MVHPRGARGRLEAVNETSAWLSLKIDVSNAAAVAGVSSGAGVTAPGAAVRAVGERAGRVRRRENLLSCRRGSEDAGMGAALCISRGELASRNFQLLLTSNVVSQFGTAVALVAIRSRCSASAARPPMWATSRASMVPVIVFLLLGGVIADRLPRQQVMAGANVLQALAQAGSAALVLTGQAQVWELMALAAVRGVGMGFYFPAVTGLLRRRSQSRTGRRRRAGPDRPEHRADLGSALGGVLVGVAGPGWGLALDAIGYTAAALLIGMRIPAQPRGEASGIVHELRKGSREFASRRWLWPSCWSSRCWSRCGTGDRGARPGGRARPARRRDSSGDRAGRAGRRGRAGRAGDDPVPAAADAADGSLSAPTSALLSRWPCRWPCRCSRWPRSPPGAASRCSR